MYATISSEAPRLGTLSNEKNLINIRTKRLENLSYSKDDPPRLHKLISNCHFDDNALDRSRRGALIGMVRRAVNNAEYHRHLDSCCHCLRQCFRPSDRRFHECIPGAQSNIRCRRKPYSVNRGRRHCRLVEKGKSAEELQGTTVEAVGGPTLRQFDVIAADLVTRRKDDRGTTFA